MEQALAELAAAFCCGSFFGAALYISLVQHPAALEAGAPFAIRFFSPMYRRAAPMQASLAALGALAGLAAWWENAGLPWLAGALLLFAVVPFTLIWLAPVNRRLESGGAPESQATQALLQKWGSLHAVRTALSGLAFVLMLRALALRRASEP